MTPLAAEKTKMSTYKGKPLVRSPGNVLYYGDPEQEISPCCRFCPRKTLWT
jgi:hypothetical protein